MSTPERDERLKEELSLLEDLRSDSTIFDFEAHGDPPAKYVISFRGGGINRSTISSRVEKIELHQCEIRLPFGFPERPPDIRWLTPIFHPNISFSGLVTLRDVGLPWEEDLTLDVICERLWDLARLAYYDEQRAANYTARTWLDKQKEVALPVDRRPLRDKTLPESSNVIRYAREGTPPIQIRRRKKEDVLYISEETPAPAIPARDANSADSGDDGILFIE